MGATSAICSTVCLGTRSCGPGGLDQTGRPHPGGVFEQLEEHRVLPGVDRLLLRGASCVSGPAPRNEEWCRAAANSMRTVIRSCRRNEREPALPPPPCGARTMGAISTRAIRWVLNHHGHTNKETRV